MEEVLGGISIMKRTEYEHKSEALPYPDKERERIAHTCGEQTMLGVVAEMPLTFRCLNDTLVGILHRGSEQATRGVLVVVGGPQYRVGSHRQFVLFARWLARAGVPVFRFDYRGMGDSEGISRTFEHIEADIRAALDAFFGAAPGLREAVIWGLCDAASAACFYAHSDSRVTGLVLLNPWVRTEEGHAAVYLKHYYFRRLVSRDFWRKIWRQEFDYRDSLRSFGGLVRKANILRRKVDETESGKILPLPKRIYESLHQFQGRVLLILSGHDLTADEFRDIISASRSWHKLLCNKLFERRELPAADHTFSRRAWRDRVAEWTLEWIRSW
jgi:exosortase A-associated hydrolase 1